MYGTTPTATVQQFRQFPTVSVAVHAPLLIAAIFCDIAVAHGLPAAWALVVAV
jgi:hypothetical protein